jgi:hypothetical protein
MRHIHFLSRRAHSRSHRLTHRHPRYHHSHSRRTRHSKRTRRSTYTLRKRRGGNRKNQNSIVVASSNGTVRSLKDLKDPLLNANTDKLPGDMDI